MVLAGFLLKKCKNHDKTNTFFLIPRGYQDKTPTGFSSMAIPPIVEVCNFDTLFLAFVMRFIFNAR